MSGHFEALREALPSYHVDFREKLAADPAVRWSERLYPDGTWHYHIFQFYQRVIQRLSADLKMPFQLTRDVDRRGDSPTHEALREAVVTALIHADHFGQGGVVIERYADRFELSNAGSLLLSSEQLLRGGISELPPEVEDDLRQRFGERFTALTPAEVQAVVTAQIEGSVTNGRMQEPTGQHRTDVTPPAYPVTPWPYPVSLLAYPVTLRPNASRCRSRSRDHPPLVGRDPAPALGTQAPQVHRPRLDVKFQ